MGGDLYTVYIINQSSQTVGCIISWGASNTSCCLGYRTSCQTDFVLDTRDGGRWLGKWRKGRGMLGRGASHTRVSKRGKKRKCFCLFSIPLLYHSLLILGWYHCALVPFASACKTSLHVPSDTPHKHGEPDTGTTCTPNYMVCHELIYKIKPQLHQY